MKPLLWSSIIKYKRCGEQNLGGGLLEQFKAPLEYGIFGEGSQISTNQKRERTVFSLLIGWNLRPFPENFALS